MSDQVTQAQLERLTEPQHWMLTQDAHVDRIEIVGGFTRVWVMTGGRRVPLTVDEACKLLDIDLREGDTP